jgi:simple sugar transport system substrate-binding protein
MNLNRRRALGLGAAGLLAATMTGCNHGATADAGAAGATKKDIKVIVISGPLTDPFFSAMKKGTEDAGKDLGVRVEYTSPKDLSNLGPDMARLGDAALAAKPNAVVASEFLPDAQDKALKSIVDAGIPVTFMNSGPNWQTLGGLTFVGENPSTVGEQAGEKLASGGAKKVLCVNHVPGNPTLEARCNGLDKAIKAAGGDTKVLNIPADQSTNPTAVTTAISGALRSDSSIDAVFTLGSGVAENAVKAVDSAGSKAVIGTTDLSKNVLDQIKAGRIAFAGDQQPYLQGYYAVLASVQKIQYGLQPIGQIGTAPLFVTKDNVADVIKSNDTNNGIRGAA